MRPPRYHSKPDQSLPVGTILRFAAAALLLVAAYQSIGFYVDSLWFQSLGFESVYWYRLRAQGVLFIAAGAASTALLWLLFRLVIPPAHVARRPFIEISGEAIAIPTAETFRSLALPFAALLGLFFGLSHSFDWNKYALFINRPAGGDIADPVFGQPVPFYLFTLPVLESLTAWLLAIAFIVFTVALLMAVLDMSARFAGISVALCVLLVAIALRTYVSRFTLVIAHHNLFTGVRYVDDHIIAPGLWFIIAALLIGAAFAGINVRAGRIRNLAIAIGIPVVTYVVVGMLIPGYVTTFVVRPNELVRESPYIKNNIEFTRRAFGLNRVEEIPFQPRVSNVVFDPNKHAGTLENIRLWDWRALQASLRQIQVIRTYYDFYDVDVDRYTIDGKAQSMMLAARELNLSRLPAGTANWVNQRLIFTHGYGLTMNPVSRFTREGQPDLILSNMPVESRHPDIRVTRPEIYFGELTDWPVYVKTRQQEFNYPEGEANNYNTYEGTGGIRMGSFFRRLLLAWSVGDLSKVPFSDDITPESALLIRRNIRERASTLAPFLLLDEDPYIVVGDDGRLYWIIDAFTTSDRYPYSRYVTVNNQNVNYMRNSVKTVVDAYNGTVNFYIFDPDDPLIQAYDRMFPDLFQPASEMPEFLRSHVRYPELQFQIQALVYSKYHVENEQVFYNSEDVWTIAQQGRAQTGQQALDQIEPFFIMMHFPGEDKLEFVSILPFTPANRNNLIGWMAARSDGEAYGALRAYHFPKTRFVDGPLQIQARIDQDPQLSSQFTLWNQQGSTIIRGNLLVMPLDDALLFAEPVYLQAERSPMPELRMVVLITQDRLAYAPRFREALNALLQQQTEIPESTEAAPGASPAPIAADAEPAAIRTLIDRANQALTDYRRLTSEGKLGEAGIKLEDLKRTIEEMNRLGVPQR